MQVVVTPTCLQNAPELQVLLGKYKLSDPILSFPWILRLVIRSLYIKNRRFVCAVSISPSTESGGFHQSIYNSY